MNKKNNNVNEVYNKLIDLLKKQEERNKKDLNKTEEGIYYLKEVRNIINNFIIQKQFESLKSLGFDYSAEIKDELDNSRWFFYHSEAKIFLAIETDGYIRYVSPYLEEKYVTNVSKYKYGSIISTKEYIDSNLSTKAIQESVDKILNSPKEERTEITVDDLPLLSMEKENYIRNQVYQKQEPSDGVKQNIKNLLQQEPNNSIYTALLEKSLQIQESIANQEISKQKQEVFNSLPNVMKEIITTNNNKSK